MKLRIFIILALLAISAGCYAQDELFGTEKKQERSGFIIAVGGNFDLPGGDMAKRFGLSYRLGPSLLYKTKTNWFIGLKFDFIFGNNIKEDSFLANIRGADGGFINASGIRTSVDYFERGYMAGLQFGKVIAFSKAKSDNGLLLLTSAGFIQHKILISTKNSGSLPQLDGSYKKGYDRLANGLFLEQFAGYNYLAKNGLINFNIGLDVAAGFTKGRRDYLFDVQKPGNESRFDLLYGIRGTWYIPIFKKKSEEYYFE